MCVCVYVCVCVCVSTVASMEANPRTPNTEPLYSQIKRPSATRRGPMTATAQWYPRRTSPRGEGNIQPSQPVSGVRSNLLNAPGTSSGGEADLDTDDITSGVPAVEVEQRPWYHSASELQHEQIQSVTSTDIDYPHISSEENDDDNSRIDPSGISTTSNDNTIINEDTSVQRMEEDLNNVWLQQDQQRHQNEQAMQTVDQASDREREEARGRIDEEQLATALQNRLSSPQPSVDPMWYRRGSGCEETGNMPTPPDECELQKSITTSPQKTVTWADQEPVVLSPRHSCESFSSQSICLEPPSASSSQQTSREGSPVMEQDHTPVPRRFSAGFVGTPPLLARRPAPEGMGAIVMFPSPHRLRKTSSGSLPPLSPTSLLSSNSSQCSGVVAAAPPRSGHTITHLPTPTHPHTHTHMHTHTVSPKSIISPTFLPFLALSLTYYIGILSQEVWGRLLLNLLCLKQVTDYPHKTIIVMDLLLNVVQQQQQQHNDLLGTCIYIHQCIQHSE